ncbi:MAG: class I SAM-dependent methyltransferase [Methylomonas sp.]
MSAQEDVMVEDIRCPLGCCENDEIILTGRDLLHDLPGEFRVVKCRTCGLMRTNPRPFPDAIALYYPDDYGPYIGTRVQQIKRKPTTGIKKLFRSLFRWVFNFNIITLPNIEPGRMLEIGCASGAFLHHMADQGWKVQGIEFSVKAAQTAMQLGHKVHAGALETAPRPDAPVDLIVGWMVLEHLYDPIGSLQKLREWASPNAWLALSIPNAGSLEFSLFKDKWYALQLPTHFYHFTPATLEKILSAGGWKLEKVYHQRILSNLIASTGYLLRDKGFVKLGQSFIEYPERAGWGNFVLFPLAWFLSIFGQTGRMTVLARIKQ